jgi:hypothetical protein
MEDSLFQNQLLNRYPKEAYGPKVLKVLALIRSATRGDNLGQN